jgi:hypothetical protein
MEVIMSMTDLLALYLARRATPAPAKPVAKPAKPAPAKPVAAAAKVEAAAKPVAKPAPVAPPAPLTAERAAEFLRAVATGSTEENKVALAGFVGFKPGEPLGVQIDRASALARSTINRAKGTPAPSPRPASPSVGGWVAGIPDMTARHVGDLKARERLALNMSLDLAKVENEVQLRALIKGTDYALTGRRIDDAEAREAARRFAWQEKEKLASLREALRQMGY